MLIAHVDEATMHAVEFPQNQWGAENRLLWELSLRGYEISNPCLVMRNFHNHESNLRPRQHSKRLNTRGRNFACCPSDTLTADCLGCRCRDCNLGMPFATWYDSIAAHGNVPMILKSREPEAEWPPASDALRDLTQ